MALLASMVGRLHTQHETAIAFLEKVLLARLRLGTEAALVLDMDIVILNLKLGQNKGAKEALADAKEKTLSLQITEPIVYSRFFYATAVYRRVSFYQLLILLQSIFPFIYIRHWWRPASHFHF